MSNGRLRWSDSLDPVASTVYRRLPQFVADRMGEQLNRDVVRTPMQWDATPNAGFCPPDVKPWLPVNSDYRQVNVAGQRLDGDSLLNLYRALFALRRDNESVREGPLVLLQSLPPGVVGYRRRDVIVLANLGTGAVTVPYVGEPLVSTGTIEVGRGRTTLLPDSAVVLQMVVEKVPVRNA